ncbi:MAG: hypothetical protein ACK5JT_14810, partial [Hyphomicrobiaceae bacterium]
MLPPRDTSWRIIIMAAAFAAGLCACADGVLAQSADSTNTPSLWGTSVLAVPEPGIAPNAETENTQPARPSKREEETETEAEPDPWAPTKA